MLFQIDQDICQIIFNDNKAISLSVPSTHLDNWDQTKESTAKQTNPDYYALSGCQWFSAISGDYLFWK